MAGLKRKANFSEKELYVERQHKHALQSTVDTLKSQVVLQKREFMELEGDAKEQLSSAGTHMKQTRQEVANMKAKVRLITTAILITSCLI